MAEHNTLTGSALHEPKGVATAASGTVYQADGSGSGTWTNQLVTVKNRNKVILSTRIPDISTAQSIFIPNPLVGDIETIYTCIHGAIATADATITAEINGVLVTGSAITVAYSGSAAGDVDSSTPSGNNTVSAGGAIEIITDGASSNSVAADVIIVMDVS